MYLPLFVHLGHDKSDFEISSRFVFFRSKVMSKVNYEFN